MTVGEVGDWLFQFDREDECDITDKIIVTSSDKAKYIFSNEGDET
jgi:hypothetical protein